MRLLCVGIWSALMFLLIFTSNMSEFLLYSTIGFKFVNHPEFDFFKPYPLTGSIVIRKMGHFLGFAVLLFLVFYLLRNLKRSVGVTLVFAMGSELLQPFFSRDGRLLDMMVNSAGVLFMAVIIQVVFIVRWLGKALLPRKLR